MDTARRPEEQDVVRIEPKVAAVADDEQDTEGHDMTRSEGEPGAETLLRRYAGSDEGEAGPDAARR